MQDKKSIDALDLRALAESRTHYPSPDEWEDQVLYFLLVDRFSDGGEERARKFQEEDRDHILRDGLDEQWRASRHQWQGGNLRGVSSKLDYLEHLGITTIWLSPIFKQIAYHQSYHGYGIQNFLAIDPHFGSEADLQELVEAAHERGMRVILDIVINHAGDVFGYAEQPTPYRTEPYPVAGFRDAEGQARLKGEEIQGPEEGIWPKELQSETCFERKGEIQDWEAFPEYVEGDFMSLKSFSLGLEEEEGGFVPSPALIALTRCYQYWMAMADIDGFRMDTVKHLPVGATRYFVREIEEYARTLGKRNFAMIGEITGGFEFALQMLKNTGLTAALGINHIPNRLEGMAKGHEDPKGYFEIFSNAKILGPDEHLWYKDNVVTMFDDHDMVSLPEPHKYRFAAEEATRDLVANAVFLNVFTLGIPCLYYGTEAGFDGAGGDDAYIRENMFGGAFGAFRTSGRHFFDEDRWLYQAIAKMLRWRREHVTLSHGRQYLRPMATAFDEPFLLPHKEEGKRYSDLVAWSRVHSGEEILLAMSTDLEQALTRWVCVDRTLHRPGDRFVYAYVSDGRGEGSEVVVEEKDGEHCVRIAVPPKGHVLLMRA